MPVELQVPVFLHMITRQSMLLVLVVVKMCQCPATSLCCITVPTWETEGTGMISWQGAAEWQLSWEEQRDPRALLCCIVPLK